MHDFSENFNPFEKIQQKVKGNPNPADKSIKTTMIAGFYEDKKALFRKIPDHIGF